MTRRLPKVIRDRGPVDAKAIRTAARVSTVGKLLPDHLYVHRSAIAHLTPELRELVDLALAIAPVGYDVVKIRTDGMGASLLVYRDFWNDPHPGLEQSTAVDFERGIVDRRRYDPENPPILHRKEEMLSPTDPKRATFAELTAQEEEAGLLGGMRIGRRAPWNLLLEENGLEIVDGTLGPRSAS